MVAKNWTLTKKGTVWNLWHLILFPNSSPSQNHWAYPHRSLSFVTSTSRSRWSFFVRRVTGSPVETVSSSSTRITSRFHSRLTVMQHYIGFRSMDLIEMTDRLVWHEPVLRVLLATSFWRMHTETTSSTLKPWRCSCKRKERPLRKYQAVSTAGKVPLHCLCGFLI